MGLKQQIEADTDKVFFNTNDFADVVIFNGKEIPIIIDADYLQGKTEEYAIALSEGEQVIFARSCDFTNGLPTIGQLLIKDDVTWYIRHAIDNLGVYELRIGRRKQ
jgi:hypothetical protein